MVENPKRQRVIGSKWIFKKNEGIQGQVKARFKEKFVAKEFFQLEGIYFNEVFVHAIKHYFISILLSLVTQYDLELKMNPYMIV